MDTEIIIVLSIMAVTAIVLIVDKLRIDMVAILCMLALAWTRVLEPLEALSGFIQKIGSDCWQQSTPG